MINTYARFSKTGPYLLVNGIPSTEVTDEDTLETLQGLYDQVLGEEDVNELIEFLATNENGVWRGIANFRNSNATDNHQQKRF